jgi:excisionase family DNA binding protein
MKVETEKLLTIPQAARLIGVSYQAVQQAIREHRIKEIRVGGHIFIPIDQVTAYEVDASKVRAGRRRGKKKEANGK